MAVKSSPMVTPADIVKAAVKTWGIALQGVAVRNVVRDTNRVPRLRDEPASGNRSHRYTLAETVMVVDGLTSRSSMSGYDPDRLLSALAVPVTVRQEARRAWAAANGQAVKAPKVAASAPSRAKVTRQAPKATGDPLGRRAIRVKAAPTAQAEAPQAPDTTA